MEKHVIIHTNIKQILVKCTTILFYSISSEELAGRRIGVFCYGSGYASAFYSIKVVPDPHNSDLVRIIRNVSDMKSKLEARVCLEPAEFVKAIELREKTQHLNAYSPSSSIENFWDDTYFLRHVDDKYRRSYGRKTKDGIVDIHGNII